MTEREKIGKFITELREQRGITQKDLAKSLRTSQSAVARMEAGKQNFSTEMLMKMSRVLNREILTLSSGALSFQIEGGYPLSGTVVTNVSKNATVALLCAALLNRGKTTLKHLPHIQEVSRLIEVLESIGVKAHWVNEHELLITPPKKINVDHMNAESFMRTRSAFMLLGPLVHLLKDFKLPHPGGCKLGARTIRPYIYALSELGIKIKPSKTKDAYEVNVKSLTAGKVIMYESSDTATECVLMAAAKIPGVTTIKFASANYQVQDLCYFLNDLGIRIEGIGTTTLVVHGEPDINKPVSYCPSEDPIESMLFISIAATTKSHLMIKRCPIDFLELELLKLEKMGLKFKIKKRYRARNERTSLVDIEVFPSDLRASKDKLYGRPFPGLNIDNLPLFAPVATQAKGQTLIHDWAYENRAIYYTELSKLGADIVLADPHRVFVNGPSELKPAEIICPPALRPSAMILVGMLAAKGTSVLRNIYPIERGYEDICNRLVKIGAKIKLLKEI